MNDYEKLAGDVLTCIQSVEGLSPIDPDLEGRVDIALTELREVKELAEARAEDEGDPDAGA